MNKINKFKDVVKVSYSSWRQCSRRAKLAVSGAGAACSLFRVEKIPISERRHLVYPYRGWSITTQFAQYIRDYIVKTSGYNLPPTHPKTVEVATMVREIVQAMHTVLGLEQDCTVRAAYGQQVWTVGKSTSSIDVGITKSMQSMWKQSLKCSTKHLEGREWRVVVIDSRIHQALMVVDTVVVHRGLLDDCSSDAELAMTIGHEIGHSIGRHTAEKLLRRLIDNATSKALIIPALLLISNVAPQYISRSNIGIFVDLWLSSNKQRRESEADYIGMILMASAGYDPQEAPSILKNDKNYNYLSTHPPTHKRMETLKMPERLKKAIELYKEVKSSREQLNKHIGI